MIGILRALEFFIRVMLQTLVNSGDSFQSLAQKHLGDASKWREIASLNDSNPLEFLPVGESLKIPSKSEVFKVAGPKLQSIATGLNGEAGQLAKNFLDLVEGEVSKIMNVIPQAQVLLGELNGVVGEVESVLDRVKLDEILDQRGYNEQVNRLIDWLI